MHVSVYTEYCKSGQSNFSLWIVRRVYKMNELLIRLLLSWLCATCRDPSLPAPRLAVGAGIGGWVAVRCWGCIVPPGLTVVVQVSIRSPLPSPQCSKHPSMPPPPTPLPIRTVGLPRVCAVGLSHICVEGMPCAHARRGGALYPKG